MRPHPPGRGDPDRASLRSPSRDRLHCGEPRRQVRQIVGVAPVSFTRPAPLRRRDDLDAPAIPAPTPVSFTRPAPLRQSDGRPVPPRDRRLRSPSRDRLHCGDYVACGVRYVAGVSGLLHETGSIAAPRSAPSPTVTRRASGLLHETGSIAAPSTWTQQGPSPRPSGLLHETGSIAASVRW